MEFAAACQHLLHPFSKRRGPDLCVDIRVAYTLMMVILTTSCFFTQINASSSTEAVMCDGNSNDSLSRRLLESETVVRGKIVKVKDAGTLVVRVLNVYRGDNSTERQFITVNISEDENRTETGEAGCMGSASKGEKYILFLRRQRFTLPEENKFDLLYDGLLGTRTISRTVRQQSEQLAVLEIQLREFDVTTTVTMETQSDAAHFEPCEGLAATSYCLNGGTCTRIVSLDLDTCRCTDDWTGERCAILTASAHNTQGEGDPDHTPAIILGCMSAFIVLLCVILAALYIRNRKKSSCRDDAGVGGDIESTQSHQGDTVTDSNQNTTVQLQELLEKEKQTNNYTRVPSDSDVRGEDRNGADSEEVAPLNTNCNRATTAIATSLSYSKQSTV